MKMRCVLLLGGVVLLCVNLAMASNPKPGTGLGGHSFAPQNTSICEGDFSTFNGICFFYEEPDNPEQQDFSLGTPNVQTGLVDIVEVDGVTVSDSLDFYLNSDGTVHVLFQSGGFAQLGGIPVCCEDSGGNWIYFVGNEYVGVSPPEVPEPSSLILLGSGILGIAGVVRRRLL